MDNLNQIKKPRFHIKLPFSVPLHLHFRVNLPFFCSPLIVCFFILPTWYVQITCFKNFKFRLFFDKLPNWTLFYLDTYISVFDHSSNTKFPFDFTPSNSFPFGSMTPCNNIPSIMYIKKPLEKIPHTSYDKSQVFKNIQIGQFPWAKFIIWDDGINMHDVCYKVWSYIGGKYQLFNPKHNIFHKHVGCQNAKVILLEW